MKTAAIAFVTAVMLAGTACSTGAGVEAADDDTMVTVEVVIEEAVLLGVPAVRDRVEVTVELAPTGLVAATTHEGTVRLERFDGTCMVLACDVEAPASQEDFPVGTVLTTCPPHQGCDQVMEFITQDHAMIPGNEYTDDCGWFFVVCRISNEVRVVATRPGMAPTLRLWVAGLDDGPVVTWTVSRGGTDTTPIVTAADLEAVDARLREAVLERLRTRMDASLDGQDEPGLPYLTLDPSLTTVRCGAWSAFCPEGAEADRITATWSGTVTGWWIDPDANREFALERLRAEAGPGAVVDETTFTWEVVSADPEDATFPKARARAMVSLLCPSNQHRHVRSPHDRLLLPRCA